MESENRILGPPDRLLLGAVAALIAVGLMMVYSATSDLAYRLFEDQAYYFKRQLLWFLIGAVAMFLVSRLDHRHWMKVSILVIASALAMLLILIFMGNQRHLFGQSVSPVELAKLAVVIYIGHWLSSKGELLRKVPYGLLPFTIMVGVVTGLVMAQPDISEAMVIVLVAVAMFFLAGADLLQFTIGITGGIAAFVLVVSQVGSAMERLEPFFKYWQDPLSSDNSQLVQGLIALGSGGLLGVGPGNGSMKNLWLPAAHTDSIFAIVGEELGLVGCLAVVGLFAILTYRGLMIARRAPDTFGSLLAIGVTCWIAFQALVNLLVVTGTMPFTGIALPFISLGGSSLVTCMVGIGILLSVSRAVNGEQLPA
jgi:cell division protein FtsW